MTRTRAGIALCAGLLLLALAPSAWASQASLSGSTVTVTANAGEANDVLINLDLEITDAAGITAGPGCTQETPTKVTCGTDFRITQISLGDANDTYFNSFFTMQSQTVDGGAGNDNLRANSLEGSVIDGGDGDDAIRGGSATDRLMGGAGNDDRGRRRKRHDRRRCRYGHAQRRSSGGRPEVRQRPDPRPRR